MFALNLQLRHRAIRCTGRLTPPGRFHRLEKATVSPQSEALRQRHEHAIIAPAQFVMRSSYVALAPSPPWIVTTTWPASSNRRRPDGPQTIVDSASSITAGPTIVSPGRRSDRR